MLKRKLVQCATNVNRDAIRRETLNGVEHIVVSSYTLPDNVVMNGGLYPAEEIAKSYSTLERTLAPIEHPVDSKGNFLSANDPEAIHNFHAGAFNMNVTQKDGRIHIEKFINVQEAMKSERGKRLIDRINELENNEKARPIHTSTGVFLGVEQLAEPMTNAAGDEYTWIAREMVFDHDAILLDSIGAAQPHQGVGMAVNANGEHIEVEFARLAVNSEQPPKANDFRSNVEGVSFNSITEQLQNQIGNTVGAEWHIIVDVFDDEVIFETNQGLFTVPWRLDEQTARIVGIPMRVDRVVTYNPKLNSDEGEAMKDLILNALKANNIDTEGMDDDALLAAYNSLQAQNSESDDNGATDNGDLAGVVANAVSEAIAPIAQKVESLESQLAANGAAEKDQMIDLILNSKKYEGFDKEALGALSLDKLKGIAANCKSAHGIPLTANEFGGNSVATAPTDMPE